MATAEARRGASAWLALAAWIAAAGAAGLVGGIASVNSQEFYATLTRPDWAPPGWIFGPVWTTLYVLMGVGAWLVWRERPADARTASTRRLGLSLFLAQLVFNALWTWVFFAWRSGAWALVDIVVLWLLIAFTIAAFHRVRRAAAWCLVPYLAWVSFATALTWAIWQANPGRL